MTNKLHIYQSRHVFADDDHIGKWDVATQTVRLREEFAGMADAVKAYFMRTHGIPMKTLVGAEEFKEAAPLMEFPDHVREAMKPELGDLTPEVVEYARENFPPEEFARRYRGRVKMESVEETLEDEEISPSGVTTFENPSGEPPKEWTADTDAVAEVAPPPGEAPPVVPVADPVPAESPVETPAPAAPSSVESPAPPPEKKKPGRKPKPQA